ncbi:uncharacterized protein LOC136079989 [Hydra vulgaris]|uniref:Uncharacterized protein LOC136079989 n=1 Tax=Hydra vulgaris TaxID=6087 RepID=A0ABM4BU50_HYDVU
MSPLTHFIELINKENLIRFLQHYRLMDIQKFCECGHAINVQKYNRCQDKHIWRCCKCKKTKTIKSGFFKICLSLDISSILQLMFLWIAEVPVTTASDIVGICKNISIQWYQYFRDICSFKIIDVPDRNQLIGPGHVFEIDESLMFKRKNSVGHVVEQHWIFGAYDLMTKKGYLTRVEDRSAATLVPLIQRWVAVGSTIHSDQWAAYNNLYNIGFNHLTVNHTTNFVDPVTQATSDHVEAFWSRIKQRLKFVCGSQGDLKWSRLDEAIYRGYFAFKTENLWQNFTIFLQHIHDKYPL